MGLKRGRLSCNVHDKPWPEFVEGEFKRYIERGMTFTSVSVPIEMREEQLELPIPVFAEREVPDKHAFFVEGEM